jgi:FMN phosphatase YigB (HAD superfamily)
MEKQSQTPVTNIIVDLTNVLFIINVRAILKSVGICNLVWYTLTKWKNPETTSLKFLDAMHNASSPRYPLISYKNYKMPDCIVANLLGLISTQEVLAIVKKAINDFDAQNYFKDAQEKKLIISLMETMFNLNLIKQNMCPNLPLINFLRDIKNKPGYKLFLLTNVGKDTFHALMDKYPDVFTLFDGAILSSSVQELKPYPPMYHALLDIYQLSPHTSVLIDDQEDNIEAARALGFNGIVYKNQRIAEKELAKLGIKK